MIKSRTIAFLLLLLAAVSCGRPAVEKHIPALLDFVPSDALAIAGCDRVCEVLSLIDSSSLLSDIDYGRLKNSRAILSLCYTTSLIPVLAIDAGKASSDTSVHVASILSQADSLGLRADYIHDGEHRGALVLSTSAAELNSARRHFHENASILDAPSFKEALDKCAGAKNWVIFRNGGADKYIPRSFLMNFVQRKEFSLFLQKYADWTTLVEISGEKYQMDAVCGDFDYYYHKLLASQGISQSKLGPMLPRSCEFAIALPVDEDDFRGAYEHWLDACVKLEKYRKQLSALKEVSGKSPLDWEKEKKVREVAVVKWNNRSVALVRSAGGVKDSEIAPNPWRGFIPALYGSAFGITDDSSYACSSGWTIFGGEDDLEAFLLCDHGIEGFSWPGKHSGLVVYGPGFMLNRDKDGFFLNLK